MDAEEFKVNVYVLRETPALYLRGQMSEKSQQFVSSIVGKWQVVYEG